MSTEAQRRAAAKARAARAARRTQQVKATVSRVKTTTGIGGIKSFFGSRAAKVGLPLIALYLAYQAAHGAARAKATTGVQTEAMGKMTPEDLMAQMMLTSTQREEQMTRQGLINQLLGTTGPALARGEELI